MAFIRHEFQVHGQENVTPMEGEKNYGFIHYEMRKFQFASPLTA
jgi:hypothetical protein